MNGCAALLDAFLKKRFQLRVVVVQLHTLQGRQTGGWSGEGGGRRREKEGEGGRGGEKG